MNGFWIMIGFICVGAAIDEFRKEYSRRTDAWRNKQ